MTHPDPYPFHRQDRRARPAPEPPLVPSDWDVLRMLIVTLAIISIGVALGLPIIRWVLHSI